MRSARCSTRCARLPELPSTNFDIAVAVAFAIGLLLFGISTAMLRKPPAAPTFPKWPQLIDESLVAADRQLRLDIIERLSIVAQPWCEDVLRQAIEQEDDAVVKSAAISALDLWRAASTAAAPTANTTHHNTPTLG